ncbi:hypothetical protein ACEY9W_23705, partial [Salmonella enterica subsp. enterica]
MELRRISVNNLFGILNYDIDLGNSETIKNPPPPP